MPPINLPDRCGRETCKHFPAGEIVWSENVPVPDGCYQPVKWREISRHGSVTRKEACGNYEKREARDEIP